MHRWHPSAGVHLKKEKSVIKQNLRLRFQTGFYRGGVTKSGHWVYMACIIELLIHLKQLKPVTKTKTFPWIQLTQERMFIETTKKPSLKWAVTYLKFTHNSAHSSCKSQHSMNLAAAVQRDSFWWEKKKKQVLADTQHGMNCILATENHW